MKRLATTVAAAGLTMAFAISGVAAQGSGAGTGAAPQQDKPSTAGVSDPGGKPTMTKAPAHRMKVAHKKMKKHKAHKTM